MATTTCKVLHEAATDSGIITKIIKFNEKIFRMVYECTNGTNRVTVQIQTADGQWAHVLSHLDLGGEFKFNVSYVCKLSEKIPEATKAFNLLFLLIRKIY
jgi:hypothetical protein